MFKLYIREYDKCDKTCLKYKENIIRLCTLNCNAKQQFLVFLIVYYLYFGMLRNKLECFVGDYARRQYAFSELTPNSS